jgi:DNA-directed RNA polymerase specialized sigma24 family protein
MMKKNESEHQLNDWSYVEIATELNMKPTTFHMASKRALEKAKQLLEKRGYKSTDFFR